MVNCKIICTFRAGKRLFNAGDVVSFSEDESIRFAAYIEVQAVSKAPEAPKKNKMVKEAKKK